MGELWCRANTVVPRNLERTKTLAFACVLVDINLGAEDIPKRIEGGGQIGVGQIVWKVVNEEIGARWSLARAGCSGRRGCWLHRGRRRHGRWVSRKWASRSERSSSS